MSTTATTAATVMAAEASAPTAETPLLTPSSPARALTDTQWETLLAFADTLVPALTTSEVLAVRSSVTRTVSSPDWPAIDRFLHSSCRDSPEFRFYLDAALHRSPASAKLARVLDILQRGGWMTYLATGSWKPFLSLERSERETVLAGWEGARLQVFRRLFAVLKVMTVASLLRMSPTALEALGYPRVDPDKPEKPQFHKFEFEELPAGNVAIDADVVIVGSGAGGGVVAQRMMQEFEGQGLRLCILERGDWIPTDQLPLSEATHGRMYAGGGVVRTVSGNVAMVAGSTWGGGTVINYSASLQTPAKVREEWSREYGLDFAETAEFQECLDMVCDYMGVSTDNIQHNSANSLLIDGCKKTGMDYKIVPQNSGGNAHNCGYCCYGCPSNQKQGGTATWLVDAVTRGAKAIQRCHVRKINFSSTNAVTGIDAVINGGTTHLTINCPRVVVAAGALYTPCLLLSSGLKNPHIGSNLKLHPAAGMWAFMPSTVPTTPWRGPILTALITEASNLDGKYYGARGICVPHHPGFQGLQLPWGNAVQWCQRILRYKNSLSTVSIARDRDSVGTVTPHPESGEPLINYTYAAFDRAAVVEGLVALAKAYVAAGAEEVWVDVCGLQPHVVNKDGVASPEFKAWCDDMRARGIEDRATSAHQMGTARMGQDEESSVCDTQGRVWGTEGLWVADSSLCPTATGVNPMVSTMALAAWVAKSVCREVARGKT